LHLRPVRRTASARAHDPRSTATGDDGHVTIGIGAQGPGTGGSEPVQRPARRVAIAVACTDRGHNGPGADRVQEGRQLVGAAVMGHLQHVSS